MKNIIYILLIFILFNIKLYAEEENFDIDVKNIKINDKIFKNQIILLRGKDKSKRCFNYSMFKKLEDIKKDVLKKYLEKIETDEYICINENDKDILIENGEDYDEIKFSSKFYPPQLISNYKNKRNEIIDQKSELGASLGYRLNTRKSTDNDIISTNAKLSPTITSNYGSLSGEFSLNDLNNNPEVVKDFLTYRYDDIKNKLTYTAGDISTSGDASFGLVGLKIEKNFDLDPNKVIIPTLRFQEKIAVPTTLDLYVGGLKRSHEKLRTGIADFDYYINNNTGEKIEAKFTDANGETKILTFNLYTFDKLLKKGLSNYSVSIGRYQSTTSSTIYDVLATNGSYKYGVSDTLTVGTNITQIGDILYNSNEINAVLFNYFTLFVSAGAAYDSGKKIISPFTKIRVGKEAKDFTIFAAYESYGDNISENEIFPFLKQRALARLYLPIHKYNISLGLDVLDEIDKNKEHSRIYNASMSLPSYKGITSNIRASYQEAPYKDYKISFNMQKDLGKNYEMNFKDEYQDKYKDNTTFLKLSKNKSYNSENDYSYNIGLSKNKYSTNLETGLDYVSKYANFNIGTNTTKKNTTYRAGVSGSLKLTKGKLEFSNANDTSYILVKVGNIPNVEIYIGDKYAGKTNENGEVIISKLAVNKINDIIVSPKSLPLGVVLDVNDKKVFVKKNSANYINFKVDTVRDYSFFFKADQIKPNYEEIAGNYITLTDENGKKSEGIIGRNGLCYLENVKAGKLKAELDLGYQGTCVINLNISPDVTEETKEYKCEKIIPRKLTKDELEEQKIKKLLKEQKEKEREKTKKVSNEIKEKTKEEKKKEKKEKLKQGKENLNNKIKAILGENLNNISNIYNLSFGIKSFKTQKLEKNKTYIISVDENKNLRLYKQVKKCENYKCFRDIKTNSKYPNIEKEVLLYFVLKDNKIKIYNEDYSKEFDLKNEIYIKLDENESIKFKISY